MSAFGVQGMSADAPNVTTYKGKPQLELLKGVSGAFRPGVLTCLMGVSGAGKTTLMDVLAGRKTSENALPSPRIYMPCMLQISFHYQMMPCYPWYITSSQDAKHDARFWLMQYLGMA